MTDGKKFKIMKINPSKTSVSDLILLTKGDKYITYFYTGFWFWKKKELFFGNFKINGIWYNYKVVDNGKNKTTTFYTDYYSAFCDFLGVKQTS